MIDHWASSHDVDRVGTGALSASAVSGLIEKSRLTLTDSRAAERSGSVRPAGRLPFASWRAGETVLNVPATLA